MLLRLRKSFWEALVLDQSSAWLALEVRVLDVAHRQRATSTPCSCQYEPTFRPLIAAVGTYAIHSPWYSPKYMRKSYGAAGGETG
jgi:hypothetical protein